MTNDSKLFDMSRFIPLNKGTGLTYKVTGTPNGTQVAGFVIACAKLSKQLRDASNGTEGLPSGSVVSIEGKTLKHGNQEVKIPEFSAIPKCALKKIRHGNNKLSEYLEEISLDLGLD